MKLSMKAIAPGLSLLLATVSVCYAQDLQNPRQIEAAKIRGATAYDKKDYAGALLEFRPLAAQGDVFSQYFLGLMYEFGFGVTQDYKEAVRLYGLAAAQGDADAQLNLGLMHLRGDGVAQDYKEAVRLFGLAAAQGNARAASTLGAMYINGQGVIQDNVYGHMWSNIAASNGYAIAAKNRDLAASRMTASQLEKAQELARECVKKNYKGC